MILMRRTHAPVRAQLRARLSTYEQARVLRACHDIRELLRPLTCSSCSTAAPNPRTAKLEGWHLEGGASQRARCPHCVTRKAS